MSGQDTASCPASMPIGDGTETIDLLCWLPVGHPGPHMEERSDEPVYWQIHGPLSESDAL